MTESVAIAADSREKLVALIQWAASPECPLEVPPMIQGLLPIWLPVWLGNIHKMNPENLDAAATNVIELATRVRDPSVSTEQFKTWLPTRG